VHDVLESEIAGGAPAVELLDPFGERYGGDAALVQEVAERAAPIGRRRPRRL
jgi:hypothetical protein